VTVATNLSQSPVVIVALAGDTDTDKTGPPVPVVISTRKEAVAVFP
jgi:hypothetical protein